MAVLALHFLLILAVSLRDGLWQIARGYTVIPVSPGGAWERAHATVEKILREETGERDGVRQVVSAYAHFAGIEAGYGYFAPNIPDSFKLVFELEDKDGHVERDLPLFENTESTLRFSTLLDQIGPLESDGMREILIKLIATRMWQRHPEAVRVRAILGASELPDVREYEAGKRASNRFLYAYDFAVTHETSATPPSP